MKEIDDTNINLDALFEGKPYHMLDAETQAYVLKEFGSVEEYETMSSSFKRIRSVITEEEDITADARVKNELLALFDKEEDRKVVPLIPRATGVGILKSPFFQLAVAASVVLVALFFIPWDGGKTSDQLALADVEKTKGENTVAHDEQPAEPDGEATTSTLHWNKTNNAQGPVSDALTSKDAAVDELSKSQNDTGVGYAGLDRNGDGTVTAAEKVAQEESVSELSLVEDAKIEKEHSENKNVADSKFFKKEEDARKKSEDGASAKTESTTKKLARYNAETQKRNDNSENISRTEGVSGKVTNSGNAVMAPSSVTVDDSVKEKDKKPVNGISLGEEKDLMQFFNTAL